MFEVLPLLVVATLGVAAEADGGRAALALGGALPGCAGAGPEGAIVDHIAVEIDDVFDSGSPAERPSLYRLANRLHRSTRERVVREQLLFAPGDPFSRRVAEESERALRRRAYLFEPSVAATSCHDGNRVDVAVKGRDLWTLSGGVSFGRRGGENSTRFRLKDINFLGTGKTVTVERSSTVDRTGNLLRYEDPNLLGSRVTLDGGYASNDDGAGWHLDVARPFFGLDTHWAAAVSALDDERVDGRYERGRVVDGYHRHEQRWEAWAGLSGGLEGRRANRWSAGFTSERTRFAPNDGAVGEPTVDALPEDRLLAYPWIGFEHVEDAFVEETNLDQIGRTEDHFVGRAVHARLGFSSRALGGDRDRLIFAAGGRVGWTFAGGRRLLDLEGTLGGRWASEAENALLGASLRYFQRDFGDNVFYLALAADWGRRLDGDAPLYLGGEEGLRGYPLRYQAGDRRFLLTVEQRLMTRWQPLQLFQVGGAVFADLGRAWWSDGSGDGLPGGGVLADVGLGLRLGHLRSGHGSVVHLDVAFPLNGDGSIRSMQWLVSTKAAF